MTFKRFILNSHKVLGLLLSTLLLMWFVSGIVMIYHTFPRVNQQDKIERQEYLSGNLPTMQALDSLLSDSVKVQSLALDMFLDRPILHLGQGRKTKRIYANTLQTVKDTLSYATIELLAKQWNTSPSSVDTLYHLDQWIPFGRLSEQFPIYKYTFKDKKQPELYLSSKTGDALQFTNVDQRFWAWLGAIPHWIYFTQLRQNQTLWIEFVKWTSIISIIMCVLGIWAGVQVSKDNRKKGLSPYRKPWHRWHHISGLLFGLFAITFIFSGFMSLTSLPDWMKKKPQYALETKLEKRQSIDIKAYQLDYHTLLDSVHHIKNIKWSIWNNYPYYEVVTNDTTRYIDASISNKITPFYLSQVMIEKHIESIYGNQVPYQIELLHAYDEDYYASVKRTVPLPVYRIKLNDELDTRHYFHAENLSQRRIDDNARTSRFLYSGMHSLNIKFLTERPWLWNLVMYTLMLGGTFLSLTGIILSLKWLRRKIRKAFK